MPLKFAKNLRVGIGYDIHRLVKRRKLFLGGVPIAYPQGLLGHSDGDVLLHAVCDALLGAAALGDIGEHFPDSQPELKGISSLKLLKRTASLLDQRKFSILNIDTVLLGEKPKITPYKKRMQAKIAQVLGLSARQVNIKATTSEGLGAVGRGRAIAAYAIALLRKS